MDFEARLRPEARMLIGRSAVRGGHGGPLAIDDLRVSSVARQPAELGVRGALEPDAHTLLLLSFDGLSAEEPVLRPDYAAVDGVEPRPLPAWCKLVEGRYGAAVALSPKAFQGR
jgi:hypothetical protein